MARVLVVEDEETILMLVSDVLELEGYEVERAREGRAALEVLQRWRPDVILLDLMMPGMSAREFRERQLAAGFDGVPVIVLSGARNARAIGSEIGAVTTILKPFDLDALIETVNRVVDTPTSRIDGSSR